LPQNRSGALANGCHPAHFHLALHWRSPASVSRQGVAMNLLEHGREKFPVAPIVASSAALAWEGVAAEIRSHPAGEIPPFTSSQTEITIAFHGNSRSVVARSSGGIRQETRANDGTIWISPGGITEEATRISDPLSNIAHLYLSEDTFSKVRASELTGGGVQSIDYAADVRDELLRQIGIALVSEMRAPTPGGRVLAESLALAMAARILQRFSSAGTARLNRKATGGRSIDDARTRRVVDYMMAHLEEPIGIDDLAAVACLSPFHFARTFRSKAGVPPHRYLSNLRLDHAKTLLARSDRSIFDIALSCQYSSQTNFTRAFRETVGLTPNAFRKANAR
jgi:AraC family transcriptional regulator